MRVLVTGGAGFIGSHLVDALVARGDDVVILDNFSRAVSGSMRDDCDLREGDIRDREAIDAALRGVDVVYHLAAQSNVMGAVRDTEYSFSTNVTGTFNVLRAAAGAGVGRLVFASSREVYGEPECLPVSESAPLRAKNAYGASKIAGEAYCDALGSGTELDVQVLRFTNVYGPRDRDRVVPLWLDCLRSNRPIEIYGGEQLLDFVWIGTAVAALLSAASCPTTTAINVGSGRGTSLLELASRMASGAARPSERRILPARSVEVVRFVADVRRMHTHLGLNPSADPLSNLGEMLRD